MERRIDCRALAEKHQLALVSHLRSFRSSRAPRIVSFCNTENGPSVRYTQMKKSKAEEVGIEFRVENYNTKTLYNDLQDKVNQYNQSEVVDGIMVQLPLPLDLTVFRSDLLRLINTDKDVDGLTEEGQRVFLPATVKSVVSILNAEVKGWQEQRIGVVGSEGEVGKPLLRFLEQSNLGVKPLRIDRGQGDLDHDLTLCGIVISCVGRENLIKAEMIKEGAVLIDVGLGDFDVSCFAKASKYTGKFGGVGPMTVISLMENVVESFSRRI